MRNPDFLIAGLKARDGDHRKDWVEKTTTGLARRFDVTGSRTSTSKP